MGCVPSVSAPMVGTGSVTSRIRGRVRRVCAAGRCGDLPSGRPGLATTASPEFRCWQTVREETEVASRAPSRARYAVSAHRRVGRGRRRRQTSSRPRPSTNPPLRPEAAQPIRLASTRTMRRPGLRCAACSAVHKPVYPPPTTRKSQLIVPVARGYRGRSTSSHVDPNALAESDRSTSVGST